MKPGFLAFAAAVATRLFQVRGRTWAAMGVGFLLMIGLSLWAVAALIGWLWGHTQTLTAGAPEAARGALKQIETMAPAVREKLGQALPALKQETLPERDVSGRDLGPVARYPGMMRTHWRSDGAQSVVEYQGTANYVAVLDHHVKGFAAQGYSQHVLSAVMDAETHEYRKEGERLILKIARKSPNVVSVRIETTAQ